ncbi:cyclic nucleotide-binding domain-containing protein [Hymenobacter gummosus]|uniref:Cyclic nucleotide-binding domain-containing protein n=1 Tax=Hymenobacter gummosus TaxID=1776032 RepID=A0A431U674_9BACT|nr:cyclic nucleotide-binding domain-containing protein [Hymenobacter gummosus]RTQ52084.1 cyclic nucleotide-binding domain-containing protein [Hymenobacter gummosus]
MTLLARWRQLLGIRAEEGRTVGLFFLHNFLLGIGTILVYVSANVILLENHPEQNLPLAYLAAAAAMIGAGKVYSRYEHHLGLQRVAVRVLLAALVLTGVLAALVAWGHSAATAVAIMAGYRVIYLLTNLEFWGVSAVVFDVRQGRRLFGVISSGDMPAKALGAVLAILIHHHSDLLWLLLTAFGAYLGALLVLRTTGRQHAVEVREAARAARAQAVAPALQRWFGSSRLVLTMCLSMLCIAAVTAGIEYSFFVNVKHRFHDQALVMQYVGLVLVAAYLLALLFKLLFSRAATDQVGVRRMLVLLPGVLAAAMLLAGGLWYAGVSEGTRLLYFCGVFVTLEVLRRALFDPLFLTLFQPLSPPERLQAHTLAKGVYEPLGLGLGGLLLLLGPRLPAASAWAPFVWMSLFVLLAWYFLHRTHAGYLAELQHALSRRFSTGPDPATALRWAAAEEGGSAAPAFDPADFAPAETSQLIAALRDKTTRPAATQALLQRGPEAAAALAETLESPEADDALVRRVALLCARLPLTASHQALVTLAWQPNLFRREAALRALRGYPPQPAEAPVFEALVQEELTLARHLLTGLTELAAAEPLALSLEYELQRVQQRLFGLLGQLYPPQLIADAQRGVAQAARERQANALEILDNLIPQPVYQALQALLEVAPAPARLRTFERLLTYDEPLADIVPTVVRRGETAFTDWTIAHALHLWQPTAALADAAALRARLDSASPLVREAAEALAQRLRQEQPELYQQLRAHQPTLDTVFMSHSAPESRISAAERVALLKHTALFAATPENVLSSIVPIMKEVSFPAGEQIFAKGDLGTSLFIVQTGEVGIFSGPQQLATFGPGDFFGELALLDAEPRSASAVTQAPVLAFRLDQDDFYDVMEERPEVLRNILRVLCQRLRRQNEKSVA